MISAKAGRVDLDDTELKMNLRTKEVRDALVAAAEQVRAEVSRQSPRRTGALSESWQDKSVAAAGPDGLLAGRVFTTDYKANWVEYGTSNQPAKRPLHRSCEALGLQYVDVTGGEDA